jgi:hypothetical protein
MSVFEISRQLFKTGELTSISRQLFKTGELTTYKHFSSYLADQKLRQNVVEWKFCNFFVQVGSPYIIFVKPLFQFS